MPIEIGAWMKHISRSFAYMTYVAENGEEPLKRKAKMKRQEDVKENNLSWIEEKIKNHAFFKEELVDLDCLHAEDGLHLHGVRVVQDMHEDTVVGVNNVPLSKKKLFHRRLFLKP
ncbi:hypothetical protein Tco_0659260 [Tanacetum coccineum]